MEHKRESLDAKLEHVKEEARKQKRVTGRLHTVELDAASLKLYGVSFADLKRAYPAQRTFQSLSAATQVVLQAQEALPIVDAVRPKRTSAVEQVVSSTTFHRMRIGEGRFQVILLNGVPYIDSKGPKGFSGRDGAWQVGDVYTLRKSLGLHSRGPLRWHIAKYRKQLLVDLGYLSDLEVQLLAWEFGVSFTGHKLLQPRGERHHPITAFLYGEAFSSIRSYYQSRSRKPRTWKEGPYQEWLRFLDMTNDEFEAWKSRARLEDDVEHFRIGPGIPE